jgi:lysyl-tRNA synthetase class 2
MTDRISDPWWTPARHEARRPLLHARARLMRRLRAHLDAQGFLEADPSALAASPGNEAHLHAFSTAALGPDGTARPLHLHTSPEFALKKLLAAGETRLYALGHVWRNRERGPLHHPEFAMLEWYRAREPYTALWTDCMAVLRLAAEAAGSRTLRFRDRTCDPFAEPEVVTVAEALARHAGIDLLATLAPDGTPDADALRAQAEGAGLRTAPDDGWSDILSKILTGRVEPHLGQGRATILDRYPAAEAALARRTPGDPRTAERFELYACGVELANGFGELTDAAEQWRRFEAEMDEKERRYGERLPLDEDFLAALALMPPASGCALGFDRVVMLATGAPRIDEVIWAPVP